MDSNDLKYFLTNTRIYNLRIINTNKLIRKTGCEEFQKIGDRLMKILGEEALCRLPTVQEGEVQTPCGTVKGKHFKHYAPPSQSTVFRALPSYL